ncbi:MAG: type IV pilus twitching motility protein PilT [Syntrophorhabdaceae bacterium]|nr:type IV pilus twitching motility protein PilT [Syntrophorhabdaceae bacterium]MDD5245070.1 type IV pilus twitching motility protein PilT [Syntrophorhabdaceae bacterium]
MLYAMVEQDASDLHLIDGIPPAIRINGELTYLNEDVTYHKDMREFFDEIVVDQVKKERFRRDQELDFSYELENVARFRINVYHQKGTIAFSVRHVPLTIPRLEDLSLPVILKELTRKPNGLVLVTGPTGSGKSTTLAAMVELINEERSLHIITVEDPIEYVYTARKSILSQREVGDDTKSFSLALRHVLRQDPDVILIGEMRDLETMQAAITAAETGHLVFSTLHTTSAAQTIDRIVDVFPPHQQAQIRSQLSITLQAVITQKLLRRANTKGRVPATEILMATPALRNLIREAKGYQLYGQIEMGKEYGMHTMEQNLSELLKKGIIMREDALMSANVSEYIK